ncbi:MAG: tetratricopeptide repeat protein [Asgard group archaeon]|nr:tetratricopeptide repeat protein [Asgard group archaeon]
MSETLYEQAKRYELIGEWEKAKEIIEEGINSKIANEEKAELKVVLAYILLRQADFDQAKQLLDSAEKIAKNTANKKLLGNIYYNFGELAYINCFMKEIGDYQLALKIHNEALAIREEIKDKEGITDSLSRIGVIHERLGDFDTGLKFHSEALKISKEINYLLGGERPLIHFGAYEERQGNLQKALEYYQEAMKVKDECGDEEGQAFRLMNIGGVLYKINKDKEEYLDYLQRGLAIAVKLDHKIGIAFINYRLGMFYSEIGEKEKALEVFQEIIEFSKPIGFIILQKIAKDQIEKIKQN